MLDGSPLSPAFSEYFMQKLETDFVPQIQNILYYFRYVDDVFLILKKDTDIQFIRNWLNTWHPNIKFDLTGESYSKLNFLDVEVQIKNGHFETTIYRKSQHPLKLTQYDSFGPNKYRKNLICAMLSRAKKICSTEENYRNERLIVRDILLNSGYSIATAEKYLKFAEYHISKSKFFGPLEKPIYYGLNYFGKASENYEREIKLLFKNEKQHGSKLIFYYKREQNLLNLFSKQYKNFGPDNGISGVYKIPCNDCNLSYIGQTGRPFNVRLKEHMNFSGSAGKYATYDHAINTGHSMNFNGSRLIWPEYRDSRRKIVESLFMKDFELLENNISSRKLNLF